MTTLLVAFLAYSVTIWAFLVAALWGVCVEHGQPAPAPGKLAILAFALSVVQALMWMRLGAGLGG